MLFLIDGAKKEDILAHFSLVELETGSFLFPGISENVARTDSVTEVKARVTKYRNESKVESYY